MSDPPAIPMLLALLAQRVFGCDQALVNTA